MSRKALKFLQKLQKSDKKLAQNIAEHLMQLQDDAEGQESIGLVWFYPLRRIRVWKYRVIYRYDDTTIYVVLIRKRDDIYEHVKRFVERM